ncbi:hypothetical protein P3L10_021615 [Capsicum annuum]
MKFKSRNFLSHITYWELNHFCFTDLVTNFQGGKLPRRMWFSKNLTVSLFPILKIDFLHLNSITSGG